MANRMIEELFTPTGNWDNHKILLKLALDETNYSHHPVLELGCGDGSSPALKAYSLEYLREVLSYDYDKEWAEKYGAIHVTDWDISVDWNKKYSVALVDESPGEQRHKSLMLLKNVCDIVIVHDSEPAAEEGYQLAKIWSLYKYKVDLVSNGAWATAMSNTYDVTQWAGLMHGEYEIKLWKERNNIAFCCVAFGSQYVKQQKRLRESILNVYPNAKLFFWTDELPVDSRPFLESLYGFKVHAINVAKSNGYRKIVYFDPAIILKKQFNFSDEVFKKYGVLAAKDDTPLLGVCSNACLDYFGIDKDEIKEKNLHLVGGSFYFFDFNQPKARHIFETWKAAEANNIFGSQEKASSEQLQGHRYDESCMALSLYKNHSEPISVDELSYNQSDEDVVIKKHFK